MPEKLLDRRFSFRFTLLILIVALMLATVTTVGIVAALNLRKSVLELFRARFGELSDNASEQVRLLLRPADDILQYHTQLAQRKIININNLEELGDRMVSELYFIGELSWLSYGDRDGEFVGAKRGENRQMYLNRSWVGPDGLGEMREYRVERDGSRTLARSELRWAYDPRTRPFYDLAAKSDGPVWTDPYDWAAGEGKGITCALALRDAATNEVLGVFTADFRLTSISDFLRGLRLTENPDSRIKSAIINNEGHFIASPVPNDMRATDPMILAAMKLLPRTLDTFKPGDTERIVFDHEGESYAASFKAFTFEQSKQNKVWFVFVVVPEFELLGNVRSNTRWTTIVSAVSIAIAVLLASILARRLSKPLTIIADDLEEIGKFHLTDQPAPRSRIREIYVVGQAAQRMKSSLRSFGRYVPQKLVQQLLSHGEEARLGASQRVVTVMFSDIEGFSRISEHVESTVLVEMLREYLERSTQIIEANFGTVDKFIGDGVLSLFNAPDTIEDHAARACESALKCQHAVAELNRIWASSDRPIFKTRIGLHTAEVLVGNMGTSSRFAYTVLGDGVNLASGMENLNKLYGTRILATLETRTAAGKSFEWRCVDRVAVKGRTQGGDVFELLGRAGEVDAEALLARDTYEVAHTAYRAMEFQRAFELFEALAESKPNDRATQMMLHRIHRYLQVPPPPDWDGLHIHTPA